MEQLGARRGRTAIVVAIVALVAALAPSIALAGGRGATVVRGIQHEYGSCGPNGDGYLMEGSLTGCWWVLTFDVKPMPVQGTVLATGLEHFEGCLGSVCGSFDTTYTYTASFDGSTELHGRCHHPITAGTGTGGFAGARGELSFTDVVDEDPFYYPYWGNIRLERDGAASRTGASAIVTLAAATLASSATAPC